MKGILFKEEMFRAVIEGRKTETRRIILEKELPPDGTPMYDELKIFLRYGRARYKQGEIIYLKEPYNLIRQYPTATEEPNKSVQVPQYKYDKVAQVQKIIPWKQKLFMPEKYARYYIKITAVLVERLHEITYQGAIDEGIKLIDGYPPLLLYESLWEEINGKGSWNENPWVWVFKFELTDKPES